jgi:predicted nucleotidyltransferase
MIRQPFSYNNAMRTIDSALLEKVVQRLVAALHPEAIYLYGSHAYGQPHENSDVDLLVVVSNALANSRQTTIEAYQALRGLCLPVEIKVVTRAEFERLACWLSSIERVAKAKGKVLYEAHQAG